MPLRKKTAGTVSSRFGETLAGVNAKLKQLIEFLVQSLVDEPEQVIVSEVVGDDTTTYEVRVAPDDLGKVIGKQGRIANALRTVAKAAAMKEKKKVYVEIVAQ